jgi:hypothetical protein
MADKVIEVVEQSHVDIVPVQPDPGGIDGTKVFPAVICRAVFNDMDVEILVVLRQQALQ